jgi:hypothetical protein
MKNTGGPAFPFIFDDAIAKQRHVYMGMSLRDWFAGKAMTTMFYPAIMESIRTDKDLDCDQVAAFAYKMADALLKERGKE